MERSTRRSIFNAGEGWSKDGTEDASTLRYQNRIADSIALADGDPDRSEAPGQWLQWYFAGMRWAEYDNAIERYNPFLDLFQPTLEFETEDEHAAAVHATHVAQGENHWFTCGLCDDESEPFEVGCGGECR